METDLIPESRNVHMEINSGSTIVSKYKCDGYESSDRDKQYANYLYAYYLYLYI